MVIREHPGKDEARSGRPFSGRTGAEIERFLDGVRLPHLAGMYATSWIKEWCGPDLDYVAADYERDREELETEIRAVRPSLILTLGRGVSRMFLGDVDMEECSSIPWKAGICQCGKPIHLRASSQKSKPLQTDAGSGEDLLQVEATEHSGKTANKRSHIELDTNSSSVLQPAKLLTTCVETNGASTRHISTKCQEETTSDDITRIKHIVAADTRYTEATFTHHQEQRDDTNESVKCVKSLTKIPTPLALIRSCGCAPNVEWREIVVFPTYNPAAGFRSPELSAQVAYGFSQLEGVINGTTVARVLYDDPIPNPVYEEIFDIPTLDEVMINATDISTDSEGYPWAPWSVQITTRPGHSYVVRYRHRNLIDRFAEWINSDIHRFRFDFHNALHDLAVFRAIGIDTRELKFDDTMIMSYVLQLEPQGLKPLCARHCNMRMMHYDEVMGDASFRLAQDWLLMSLEMEDEEYKERQQEEFVRLTTTPYLDAKGKTRPGRRLKTLPKLPKSDLHKSIERCLRSVNPRKLWGDQVLDRHVDAGPKYGRIWDATLDHVPLERAVQYAGRDSDGTRRLKPVLVDRLHANELWPVYCADLATVPLIDRMQQIGIKPDLGHFRRLGEDLGVEIQSVLDNVRSKIRAASGTEWSEFNPNSTYHVGELLYDRFNVDVLKRTPGGDPSTNDKILEALEKSPAVAAPVRELISSIREYREVYKLKHTFVDQIPEFVNRWPFDGRIHATFRITRTVTGRLACSDPNLLAMPKHGKFASRFREGFVAGVGAVLASWDLSQIELRVLAHLSQDEVLLNAFRTGQDLHAKLAQRIFGGTEADHKKGTTRLAAKAVNFGIPMGMTNVGLCIELRKNGVDVNEADAQRWLDETMSLYHDVPVYQQAKIAEARRYGFVTDLRGRRRYIGGIRSWDDAIRSEAERFAFSTPIQAGAQEVMHEAEAYVYTYILLPRWKRGEQIEPLIQIHDDLLMECDKKIVKGVDAEMVYAMTHVPAHWLSVPIETSGDCGTSWGKMTAIREEQRA